jgi:hypothetical protein
MVVVVPVNMYGLRDEDPGAGKVVRDDERWTAAATADH